MALFTLIFEYENGSYITQAESGSIEKAAEQCIVNWDIRETYHNITNEEKTELIEQLNRADLFQLDNLRNVWCIGGMSFRGSKILLKLVKTDENI